VQLGTDIIEIQRIKGSMQRHPGFCQRILTPREYEIARSRPNPVPFVAGRFAAKEAVVKCLGLGLRGFKWQDMEILPDQLGRPVLTLSPRLAELARRQGIGSIRISISHSRDYALAMAIGEEWGYEDCNRLSDE